MPPAGMSMLPASVVAIVASVLIALGEHVELLMAGGRFLAGAAVGMVFPALLTRLGGVLSYPQMLGFGACVAVVTAVFVSVVSRHD